MSHPSVTVLLWTVKNIILAFIYNIPSDKINYHETVLCHS